MNIQTKLDSPIFAPFRAHATDAGADLFSTVTEWLPKGGQIMVDTGVSVKIPEGFMGAIVNRSSQGKKGIIIPNSLGIIDSDYRGNLKVILRNMGQEDYHIIRAETRIAQLIIIPIILAQFVPYTGEWLDTERGEGGFGSTGK